MLTSFVATCIVRAFFRLPTSRHGWRHFGTFREADWCLPFPGTASNKALEPSAEL